MDERTADESLGDSREGAEFWLQGDLAAEPEDFGVLDAIQHLAKVLPASCIPALTKHFMSLFAEAEQVPGKSVLR